jgi:hypothetical protein
MSEVETIHFTGATVGDLGEQISHSAAPLIWLLHEAAAPDDGTLAALLEHSPGPAASLVIDEHDEPLVALLGRTTEDDVEGILEAANACCLPLRHIPLTSLLVERDLALGIDPPDTNRFGWYAGTEWTARLFRSRPGMLVPASRVRVEDPGAGSPAQLMRAARSARWRKGETLRELHRVLVARAS